MPWGTWAIGVAILLLFLSPSGIAGSPSTTTSAPATAHGSVPGSPVSALASAHPATPRPLPGSTAATRSPMTPATTALVHLVRSGPNSTPERSGSASASSVGARPDLPPPPGSLTIPPEGWFLGTVKNESASPSDPTSNLSGVSVQAFADASSTPCPTQGAGGCLLGTTNNLGMFNVTCEVGPDYLTFNANFYAENLTYSTCQNDTATSVGTILMVPDGIVIGSVHIDTAGQPAISGVSVQGCNRGCTVVSAPTVSTNSTGGFRVPVPPGTAAQVDFQPPGITPIYQQNFTTVEVGAGQTDNIGTVYLEPNAVVKAELYDQVTGSPISGSMAMTVCSIATSVCGPQGSVSGGPYVEAVGPPGEDYAIVMAAGSTVDYLVNTTPIGAVPGTSAGHPYCVPYDCKIFLMPVGEVKATIGISGNWTHLWDAQNTGLYTVSVSSLDGFQVGEVVINPATYGINMTTTTTITAGCLGVVSQVYDYAFPLRNSITVAPDTTGVCGFGTPTWPIPGYLPVWANTTVFNGTPYDVTDIGYLNLTPGVYVEGTVYAAGTTLPPSNGFQVTISSRITTALANYAWPPARGDTYPPSPCDAGAGGGTTFCTPAPPGPDELQVTAPGYPANNTWINIPWRSLSLQWNGSGLLHEGPLPLANVTLPSVTSLNLTLLGTVTGTVVNIGTQTPVPFAAVTVCPAASQVSGSCENGITNYSGGYSIPAVSNGWMYVTAVASGDQSNSEWVNVSGPTASPVIPLQRDAVLSGSVVSTGGTPIIGAGVTYCLIDASGSSGSCSTDLGAGVTQSDGNYQGLVRGGNFPWSTYELEASAPGYLPDWTFVNATPNATVVVPTLVLTPVGQASSIAPTGAVAAVRYAGGAASTWVTGRVVDNATGAGVVVNSLTACLVDNPSNCILFSLGTDSGGLFNQSVPLGAYNLTITASGFSTLVAPLSVFSTPHDDAGTFSLMPESWVQGNVTLSPWSTINVTVGTNRWVETTIVPATDVEICAPNGICTGSSPVGTSGLFVVPGPVGFEMQVTAVPTAPGGVYTAPGGALRGVAITNITAGETSLPSSAWPSETLFATVSGSVWNANSWNAALQSYTTPAWWAEVQVETSGPVTNALVSEQANTAGDYTVFLPGGNPANDSSVIVTGQEPFWYRTQVAINASLGPLQNFSWTVAPIGLTLYGFADLKLVGLGTGAPAVGVGVSASYSDTATGRAGSSSGISNGAGFVNLTAPSGEGVQFQVGGSQDYNTTTFTASVPQAGVVNLTYPASEPNGTVEISQWGWVRSTYVDYSAPVGYPGAVVDQTTGRPIPDAAVSISSFSPIYGAGDAQPTNLLGQFLSDAPVGTGDLLTVSHPGFVTNTTTPVAVASGATVQFSRVNLTGYGVVAGQVLSQPGLYPVPDAQVKICPGSSSFSANCVTQVTNNTGWYWMTAYPATDSIYVSAPNFLANYSETFPVAPDSWQELPAYILVEYGAVTGLVRGLPTGLTVAGAAVSVCSPIGSPTGPCSVTASSAPNGSFAMSTVPGSYVLAASALDYNASYLPVSVIPGETVNVGAIFLTEFGIISGSVVDASTGLPIVNASVDACPIDTLLTCSVPTQSGAGGGYRIAADPGSVTLTFAAASYVDTYLTVVVPSGATVTAPTVALIPVSQEFVRTVSGRVAPSADPSGGIGGAIVNFYVGGTRAYTAIASATGLFSIGVTIGEYTLVAAAAGYGSASALVDVNASVSGLVFTLSTWGWNMSLVVEDGLTQTPIVGAAVTADAVSLGTTDGAGRLAASLPNGTYLLTVQPPAALGSAYVPLTVTVEVSDAPVARLVDLYPAISTVTGTVRSTSGAPIPGATVTLTGTASDGASFTVSRVSDAAGQVTLPAYAGSYTAEANASGYASATEGLSLAGGPGQLALTLAPAGPAPAGTLGSSSFASYVEIGAGIALIAGAVGALQLFRRRPEASR